MIAISNSKSRLKILPFNIIQVHRGVFMLGHGRLSRWPGLDGPHGLPHLFPTESDNAVAASAVHGLLFLGNGEDRKIGVSEGEC